MDLVKPISPAFSPHVAILIGELMTQIRAVFEAEDWQGLRQSHFRLLSMIPELGVSITDLGELLGMTKQGCGQFVAFLAESGYLLVAENPDDRRARIVQRTVLGDKTVQAVNERIYRIEQEWAALVGPRRYATFRRVLVDLVGPDEGGAAIEYRGRH
jgi:DNA-binding MarR family transcriptional regulator